MSATLTDDFKAKINSLGVTQLAVAKMMGITPQQFSEIWNGSAQPSTTFIVKAIQAGLGESFSDIAEVRAEESQHKKRKRHEH
ncbi:helix-turn-helix transcriptional regulator [Actinotignum urinale]|uniref:helix-turn-helix domain-containing protein n=1 Tax=Actinotignum urinale TaxID=190146 RepID=UPI002A7F7EAC|nr:helix-turn-helix transcriptional regulator [Actinotignum urinale]MDY5151371.1 helix-turn-helix transcriptional regulator [Actinotignum urinale]